MEYSYEYIYIATDNYIIVSIILFTLFFFMKKNNHVVVVAETKDNKTETLRFLVTTKEKTDIQRYCKNNEITFSDLCRDNLFKLVYSNSN